MPRGAILEQVSAGADPQNLGYSLLVAADRENAHVNLRVPFTGTADHLEAMQPGHVEIHDCDIRPERLDQVHSLAPVGRLADNRKVGFAAQNGSDSFAHDRMIVGKNNADSSGLLDHS